MLSIKSKAKETSISSNTKCKRKVMYGWSYMERKGKPFALMGWSQDNRLRRTLEDKTSHRSRAYIKL